MIGIIFTFKFALFDNQREKDRERDKERDVKRNFISSTSNVT